MPVEYRLRKRSKEVVTDNLQAGVPCTFSLKSGGEEIRAALIPDLKAKIFQMLDKNKE